MTYIRTGNLWLISQLLTFLTLIVISSTISYYKTREESSEACKNSDKSLCSVTVTDSGLVTFDVVNLTSSEQERLSLISKTSKHLVTLLLVKSFV